MKNKINVLAILTFYSIAIVLRYLINKTDLLESVSSNFLKVVLQGISPAICAIAAFYIFKINLKFNLKGNYSKTSTPLLLYWALPVLLISAVAYFTRGAITPVAVTSILLYGLLEEIGWRGFLQQELKPFSEFLNPLLVAFLWFIWHLNFDLTSSNLLFFAILILGSWGIRKVADSTHFLLAVSAFYSFNYFFSVMDTTKTILLVTLLIIWITSLLSRQKRLNQTNAGLSTTPLNQT